MITSQGFNEPWIGGRGAIVDTKTGKATALFTRWMEQTLQARVQASPVAVNQADVQRGKSATLNGTLASGNLGGLLRITCYLQVVTPAGVSSSWQVTIGWTYRGVVQSKVFALVNTNTINTYEGELWPVWTDPGTPVTYTVTYASNPAAAMVYDAVFLAELLQSIGPP